MKFISQPWSEWKRWTPFEKSTVALHEMNRKKLGTALRRS
jgi:hypothetical protein